MPSAALNRGIMNTVFLTGEPASGIAGSVYHLADTPVMNSQGKIAFVGGVGQANPTKYASSGAIWTGDQHGIALLAKPGSLIDGITDATFSNTAAVANMLIAPNGDVAFMADLQGIAPTVIAPTAQNRYAIVVASNGRLVSVVRNNDPAPGFAEGTKLRSVQPLAFTEHGLLLSAAISGEPQAYSLWLWKDSELSLVAVNNPTQVAWLDLPQNHVTVDSNPCYIQNFNGGLQMNNQGDIVFSAYLSSTTPSASCPASSVVTVIEKSDGIFYPLIRAGEAIPNLESGNFRGYFSFALADDGKVGVADQSKWVVDKTGSKLLLSFPNEKVSGSNNTNIGDAPFAPLAGLNGEYLVGSYHSFLLGSPRANPYTSLINLAESPLAVLWLWENPLPGYNNAVFSSTQDWSYSRSGGLFFVATVVNNNGSGPVEQALWLRDAEGQLTKMIATGDTISGSTSKIKGITLVSGSVMNGLPASISDTNSAVVEVLLEDRKEAIVVITP